MTCSRAEAKLWIRKNWTELCDKKELTFVLRRYYAVYQGKLKPQDDYVKLKRTLEKLAIDKSD